MSKIEFTDSWKTYVWFLASVVGLVVRAVWNEPLFLHLTMLLAMFYFLVMAFEASLEYLLLNQIGIEINTNLERAIAFIISAVFTATIFLVGSGLV